MHTHNIGTPRDTERERARENDSRSSSFASNMRIYRVARAFSKNGSNETVTRLTPFRLICFTCFPTADSRPADRRSVPEKRTDMVDVDVVGRAGERAAANVT